MPLAFETTHQSATDFVFVFNDKNTSHRFIRNCQAYPILLNRSYAINRPTARRS